MPCGRGHELCQPRTKADRKPSGRATSVFARLREYPPSGAGQVAAGAASGAAPNRCLCAVRLRRLHGGAMLHPDVNPAGVGGHVAVQPAEVGFVHHHVHHVQARAAMSVSNRAGETSGHGRHWPYPRRNAPVSRSPSGQRRSAATVTPSNVSTLRGEAHWRAALDTRSGNSACSRTSYWAGWCVAARTPRRGICWPR